MARRASNQYTLPVTRTDFVTDLLRTRCNLVDKGLFTCYEPVGPGVIDTRAGYCRVNFRGKKPMAHVLVFQEMFGFNPCERNEDTSHKCGNPRCCNPEHLVSESRVANISRRGCIGFLQTEDGLFHRLCVHVPPCCVSRDISEFPVFNEDDVLTSL